MKTCARAIAAFAAVLLTASPVAAGAPARELKEGDAAPAFKTQGDDGKEYSLESLRGRTIVLYFYPQDDTPGCTVEAQQFRDDAGKFAEKNAVILGVSLDDAASHKAFREKYQLNFTLLVGGKAIAEAYGVPIKLGYPSRQTFVIGPDGKLRKIYRGVKAKGHSGEVLQSL
jgi:peroxiredoxin Q/BCP